MVLLLADVTVVLHLAFVLFVLGGGLLVLRWRSLAWVHVPSVVWAAWIEIAGWYCPLTPLENWLRDQGGATRYSATFVEHYLLPVLYPATLTRELQWGLAAAVLAVNGAVYALVLSRRSRRTTGR
jgi:hypothetical protein